MGRPLIEQVCLATGLDELLQPDTDEALEDMSAQTTAYVGCGKRGPAHAARLKSENMSSGRACAISPHSCHIGASSVAQVTEHADGKPPEQSPEGMASQHGRTWANRSS